MKTGLLVAEIFKRQGLEIIALGPFSFSRDKSSYNQYSRNRGGSSRVLPVQYEDFYLKSFLSCHFTSAFCNNWYPPCLEPLQSFPTSVNLPVTWHCLCSTKAINTPHILSFKKSLKGFPGGTVVENLPANAGDTGSSPGLGRSHMPQRQLGL